MRMTIESLPPASAVASAREVALAGKGKMRPRQQVSSMPMEEQPRKTISVSGSPMGHAVEASGGARDRAGASLATGDPRYIERLLKSVGLRPTRHRVALGCLLFGGEHQHVTAEMLFEVATSSRIGVSLATVYNTLNQFTEVGLLRQIGIDGTKTYFDTNVSGHGHFYDEQSHELIDIPEPLVITRPEVDLPVGYEVHRIDVVIRLRPKSA
jgi:Fur family iron response transcriptional regulator